MEIMRNFKRNKDFLNDYFRLQKCSNLCQHYEHCCLKLQRTFFKIFMSYIFFTSSQRKVFGIKGKKNKFWGEIERWKPSMTFSHLQIWYQRVIDKILNEMKTQLSLSRIVWLSKIWKYTSRAYGIIGNRIVLVCF